MDRFHAILHSGEIRLADATTMVIIIFVVRRTPGTFATFARTLQSAKGPLIRWDEPDLRNTDALACYHDSTTEKM